jgi:hypothetical protein
LAACGAPGDDPGAQAPDPFVTPVACTSGVMKDPNESPSGLMMPGRACIACHDDVNASTDEAAPVFKFAGTLYRTGHEPDDCVGADAFGAQVWVTDATGFIFGAKANRSGNFSLETRLPFLPPFMAKVLFRGRERAMVLPQTSGDCNACHTQEGVQGAPGRLALP